MSARGWGYYLEGLGEIGKGQFDYVEGMINDFREDGRLPLDFTAMDASRAFDHTHGLKEPPEPDEYIRNELQNLRSGERINPAFWVPTTTT